MFFSEWDAIVDIVICITVFHFPSTLSAPKIVCHKKIFLYLTTLLIHFQILRMLWYYSAVYNELA
ncbi:unnamed protein product [Brugia timori]|uniref:Secreted protein n=1 Tax=Brugia timori TaxID=42155 RepID=A0A0R3QA88_9BILA|nr:unnamed protein product [Brugia timori]